MGGVRLQEEPISWNGLSEGENLREHKLGVGGGEQLNKVQTEVNFWVDFVEESCEFLAVDGDWSLTRATSSATLNK
jgi:hypothetical protein